MEAMGNVSRTVPALSPKPLALIPLGLDLRIETPENVVLTYQLAGPALRALAYSLDFAFRVMIMIAVSIVVGVVASFLPGLAIGSLLLAMFLLEWGYTIGFEY